MMFGLATECTESFLVTSWWDGGGTERVDVTDDIERVGGGGGEDGVVKATRSARSFLDLCAQADCDNQRTVARVRRSWRSLERRATR